MWRLKIVREGLHDHSCTNGFRFQRDDGRFASPTAVSAVGTASDYGQDCVEKAFNAKPPQNPDRFWGMCGWCGWFNESDPDAGVVMTFASPESFRSYQFKYNGGNCNNQIQGWRIDAKNSGDSSWTTIQEEDIDCSSQAQANEVSNNAQEFSLNQGIYMFYVSRFRIMYKIYIALYSLSLNH